MARDQNPLFTVIIPTKDRADYLYHTLRTCSLQNYENFEVIVSDDGSRDHTREVVLEAGRKDSRIRYVTPSADGVGMRDNFEFALDQVRPGFVMALGGDDGLLPYGIQGMRNHLLTTGQEMLCWPTPIYSYPKAKTETGQLVLHHQGGQRIVESKRFLENQVRDLHYVSDAESPMFYVKGVVATHLVERVRSRSVDGRFYACATPDGYSGIVLAGEVESWAFSGEPYSIFGTSPTSQGLGYLASNEQAKKRSEAFYRDAALNPMHPELGGQPYSPLISLMTADYLLTARDLPGWPGNFPAIDYRDLLKKSLYELAHGLYAEDRVVRELRILEQIADHHGLGEYFRQKVAVSRRYKSKKPFEGNGISTKLVFIDCDLYGIRNVLDAAYVAHYWKRFQAETTLGQVWKMLVQSFAYRLRSFRKGSPFPAPAHWSIKGSAPTVAGTRSRG